MSDRILTFALILQLDLLAPNQKLIVVIELLEHHLHSFEMAADLVLRRQFSETSRIGCWHSAKCHIARAHVLRFAGIGCGIVLFGAVFLGDLHGVEALVESFSELLEELFGFGFACAALPLRFEFG